MAFTKTYAGLQAKVLSLLDDSSVDAEACITLAEAEIRDRASIGRAEVRDTDTIDEEFAGLPDGFGQLVSLTLQIAGRATPIRFVDPATFAVEARCLGATTGAPQIFTITDEQLRFAPTPDTAYEAEIVYRQELEELSDSTTTNWLLERWPNVYLYGALKHGAIAGLEDQRAAGFEAVFSSALDNMSAADNRRRAGQRPRLAFRALA